MLSYILLNSSQNKWFIIATRPFLQAIQHANKISLMSQLFLLSSKEIKWRANGDEVSVMVLLREKRNLTWVSRRHLNNVSNCAQICHDAKVIYYITLCSYCKTTSAHLDVFIMLGETSKTKLILNWNITEKSFSILWANSLSNRCIHYS